MYDEHVQMKAKKYHNESIKHPGAYLPETILQMGAYSRGAYSRGAYSRGLLNFL